MAIGARIREVAPNMKALHAALEAEEPPRVRVWTAIRWSAIAAVVLLAGGLGARGLMALMGDRPVVLDGAFVGALVLFSVGGGVTLGVLIYAWLLAAREAFTRLMVLVAFAVVLFALFVWPTPYKYYRTDDLQTVLRVNRITGAVEPVVTVNPRQPE